MKEVDYAKLSEQYGSFLVAVGGVSITVLAIILGWSPPPETPLEDPARLLFLVAALIAATVCCFSGAHMMAEVAAVSPKLPVENADERIPLGQHLFVLATSNIFIAVILVLFAIVLLPAATGKFTLAENLRWISGVVFVGVVLGALCWMALASLDRMNLGKKHVSILLFPLGFGVFTGCYASSALRPQATFIFIVAFTIGSLVYFAIVCKVGRSATRTRCLVELGIFSSCITISSVSLVFAYFKILNSLLLQ